VLILSSRTSRSVLLSRTPEAPRFTVCGIKRIGTSEHTSLINVIDRQCLASGVVVRTVDARPVVAHEYLSSRSVGSSPPCISVDEVTRMTSPPLGFLLRYLVSMCETSSRRGRYQLGTTDVRTNLEVDLSMTSSRSRIQCLLHVITVS